MSGKVGAGEEEEGKEGEGERKAECVGGKKARRVIEESFSGKSNPQNPLKGLKSGVSEGCTVEKGRF